VPGLCTASFHDWSSIEQPSCLSLWSSGRQLHKQTKTEAARQISFILFHVVIHKCDKSQGFCLPFILHFWANKCRTEPEAVHVLYMQ